MNKHAASARKALPRAKVITFEPGVDEANLVDSPHAKPFTIEINEAVSNNSSIIRAYADDKSSPGVNSKLDAMSDGGMSANSDSDNFTSFERVLRN